MQHRVHAGNSLGRLGNTAVPCEATGVALANKTGVRGHIRVDVHTQDQHVGAHHHDVQAHRLNVQAQ